jgi:integrase
MSSSFRRQPAPASTRHNLLSKVLAPAARRAGVPWVTIHTFRHTCASLLFAPPEYGGGGKNAKQVQEWLGHHSPAYTLKEYVHLIEAGVGDASFLDVAVSAPSVETRHHKR